MTNASGQRGVGSGADLRSLELLLRVAELGSIGQAAAALGIRQPSATERLRRLERDLGIDLVVRTPRGTVLTDAGAAVAGWARQVLAASERMSQAVEALKRSRASELHVAASMTLAEYLLPHVLTDFRAADPAVRLALKVCNSEHVIEDVRSREVQLGFIECPTVPQDLRSRIIAVDHLAVVVPLRHPWAQRGTVTCAELLRQLLVVREPGSGTRETLDRALRRTGVDMSARPDLELGSTAAIKSAVADGHGVGIVSRLAISAEADPRLSAVEVTDLDLSRRLRTVWRRDDDLVGAARLLADCAGRRRT